MLTVRLDSDGAALVNSQGEIIARGQLVANQLSESTCLPEGFTFATPVQFRGTGAGVQDTEVIG